MSKKNGLNTPDKIKKLTETVDYNLEIYQKGSCFEQSGYDILNAT